MNNTSLYSAIYDQSVMLHECVYHDDNGYEQTKRYTFKSAIAVNVGDLVLCQTRGWFRICTVKAVNVSIPMNSDIKYNWIVGVVSNMVERVHADLLYWESNLIEEINRKRAEHIRMQMIQHLGVHPNELTLLMSHDDGQEVYDDNDS